MTSLIGEMDFVLAYLTVVTALSLIMGRMRILIGCVVIGITSTAIVIGTITSFEGAFAFVPLTFLLLQWIIALRALR